MPDRNRLSKPPKRLNASHRIIAAGRVIAAGAVLALSWAAAMPIHAQAPPTCAERHQLLAFLQKNFEEKPTAVGVTADGQLLEVLSNPSGSWTLVVTRPGGLSCMVSSGQGWRQKPQQRKDPIT